MPYKIHPQVWHRSPADVYTSVCATRATLGISAQHETTRQDQTFGGDVDYDDVAVVRC